MFSLRGIPRHRITSGPRSIAWDAGKLSGDRELVDLARIAAAGLDGVVVAAPGGGPASLGAHLHDPDAAAVLLTELFVPGTVEGSGDLPPALDLPPDSIP